MNDLPTMEFTFELKNVVGEETKESKSGEFVYKRPNIRLKSEIAKTTARLNGGLTNIDDDTALMHEIFATLRHTLTEYPKWWEKSDFGFELYDFNIVIEIWKKTQEFEKEWFDKVWSDKDENEKASGDGSLS